MDLLRELAVYRPWNEQEERDCAELLRRLHSGEELYSRDNAAAHLTVSAWVVSPDRSQVLMATSSTTPGHGWAAMPTATATCWQWPSGKSGRNAA